MKRKPYIAQEKEILLQSIAIEKLQIVVQHTKKNLSCMQLENIYVEKTLEITTMRSFRGTEIK